MQTNTEIVRELFGDMFLADRCLDLLESAGSLPEYIPLPIELLTRFSKEGFEIFYIPPINNKVGVTSDLLMSFWKKTSPTKELLYDFNDEYKWYTKSKDCFWYKESLQEGWLLMRATPLSSTEFTTYNLQRKKLAEYLEHILTTFTGTEKSEGVIQKIKKEILVLGGCTSDSSIEFDHLYRSSFAEELLRMMCYLRIGRDPILGRCYVWTSSVFGDKEMVRIGFFDEDGADVTKRDGTDGNSQTSLTPVLHL